VTWRGLAWHVVLNKAPLSTTFARSIHMLHFCECTPLANGQRHVPIGSLVDRDWLECVWSFLDFPSGRGAWQVTSWSSF